MRAGAHDRVVNECSPGTASACVASTTVLADPIRAASIPVRRNKGVRMPGAQPLIAVSALQEGAEVEALRFGQIVYYMWGGSHETGSRR
jgi:hypothetical protein